MGAAVAGVGIIYTFEEYLGPLFEQGALVPVLPDWWQAFDGPYLYYNDRRHVPSPLRAFVDFLKAENGGEPSRRLAVSPHAQLGLSCRP